MSRALSPTSVSIKRRVQPGAALQLLRRGPHPARYTTYRPASSVFRPVLSRRPLQYPKYTEYTEYKEVNSDVHWLAGQKEFCRQPNRNKTRPTGSRPRDALAFAFAVAASAVWSFADLYTALPGTAKTATGPRVTAEQQQPPRPLRLLPLPRALGPRQI